MCLQQKKRVRVPKALGSNVENGFGVIFLHANEIIMRALRAYQKQAFISVSQFSIQPAIIFWIRTFERPIF